MTKHIAFDSSWVASAIQDVGAESPVFGLRDDTGTSMQTLKIIPYHDGYLGVYHCLKHGRFEVRLATSTNLHTWTYRGVLDTDASQPTLASAPDGGYLLAVEADNDAHTGPGRRFLRLRYYAGIAELMARNPLRTFNAPHTLTAPRRGAEGTPNIYRIALDPDITHSRITVGFHYLTGGVDREAVGILTNFRMWSTRPDTAFDRALSAIGMRGKHGDRDSLRTVTGLVDIVECQNGSAPTWRIALYDPARKTAKLLSLRTPGASTSFANPTVTYTNLPNGQPGVVMTMFMPQTGAAHGESGELLYFRQAPAAAGRTSSKSASSSSAP